MIIILQADVWLSLDDISLILFREKKLLLWAVVFGNHGLGKEIQKVVPSSNSTRCSACCFSGTLKNSSQPFLVFVLVSSGCDNKYHRLCFNHRKLSPHCSRVSKSKIEVLAGLVSPEASLLGLKIAIPTANSHRAFPLGRCLLVCLPLLIRTYVLCMLLLLLPSHFSHVRLCAMP